MSKVVHTIRAGFIPLVDAGPLIVAKELGFAAGEHLELALVRDTSWATIRDRLAVAHLDVAHILAPMPVAANLGLTPLGVSMVVPMALGSGANTITVARRVYEEEIATHLPAAGFDAEAALAAVSRMVAGRRRDGRGPLTLGIVHPFSAHNYELSYWLAASDIDLVRDVEFVVVPPPLMPDALAERQIDGFCAGEPWGTSAVQDGSGVILTTNAHIWRNSPEKVLGARGAWAEEDADRMARLIRAVYRAALWCDAPENREELAQLLSRAEYVGLPAEAIRPGLERRLRCADGSLVTVEGFLNFSTAAATFPWVSHALWFYSQMVRWGQAVHSEAAVMAARGTYRPDLYRSALKPIGVPLPAANAKVEGALREEQPAGASGGDLRLGPDAFFDGRIFDPDCLEDYLATFAASDESSAGR